MKKSLRKGTISGKKNKIVKVKVLTNKGDDFRGTLVKSSAKAERYTLDFKEIEQIKQASDCHEIRMRNESMLTCKKIKGSIFIRVPGIVDDVKIQGSEIKEAYFCLEKGEGEGQLKELKRGE